MSDRGRSRGDTPPDHKMSDQSDDEFDTGQGQAVSRIMSPPLPFRKGLWMEWVLAVLQRLKIYVTLVEYHCYNSNLISSEYLNTRLHVRDE